jgi:hypothetical protein
MVKFDIDLNLWIQVINRKNKTYSIDQIEKFIAIALNNELAKNII